MTVIEKAVQWAIQTANDNSHGYSQVDRWGTDQLPFIMLPLPTNTYPYQSN